MANAFDGVLAQVANLAVGEIDANKAAILAAAAAENVKAADAIVQVVEAALPKNGVFAVLAPVLKSALDKAAPELVTALGGEEAALLAAAEAALKAFAQQHGG